MPRILVIGGSFAGLGAVKSIIQKTKSTIDPFEVFLVEPKLGILNILGIPKAVIDPDFAVKSFVSYERANIYWDSIKLQDGMEFDTKAVLHSENGDKPNVGIFAEEIAYNQNVKLHFIQGRVFEISKDSAIIQMAKLDKGKLPEKYQPTSKPEEIHISFDSCIIASGRTRNWPLDPLASTERELRAEMTESLEKIVQANKIVIIGGGALGVELAGEIKSDFPEKHVSLIHPHGDLPPEALVGDKFKEQTLEFLKNLEVEVLLNTRVENEHEDGTLQMTDGREVKSDLNFWCNYKRNNVEFLNKHFPSVFAANGDILVTHQFEMKNQDGEIIKNIFAVGDLADLPLVKTAGWAFREGCQAGINAVLQTLGETEGYEAINKDFLNKGGMLLVVGPKQSVCIDFLGVLTVNEPEHLEMYKDYRLSGMFGTYGLNE
ncbi:hypothetical protein KL906_003544 [Ogataea polymorpha]|uniref:FAD/NAD(P)-binding domain-containing protein n=1 Tax=Ogataea polymorpha TaxID=460523 RepID=A0A9P8NQC4_9ASCO|nr:hypothetical protein KL906_003544 [Ogataea polymorpha]KAG7916710.1 hypothetical protein KL927_003349 [Ogataea polymorpha]KAH3659063.1 hypothetical protein OGATHE_006789 [Ogataea polymorpha]